MVSENSGSGSPNHSVWSDTIALYKNLSHISKGIEKTLYGVANAGKGKVPA